MKAKSSAKRKPVSKSVRFEVFKRDLFTCQYCGAKSPDAVLHVDHLLAVSKGGGNDLVNLVTACVDCNLGKSNKQLSDVSLVAKQRTAMETEATRVEQMRMLAKWHRDLRNSAKELVSELASYIEEALCCEVTPSGLKLIEKWTRSFPHAVLFESIDASARQYIELESGAPTIGSQRKAFSFIPRIAAVKCDPDQDYRAVAYTRGILRNRLAYFNDQMFKVRMFEALDSGVSTEHIQRLAKQCRNWTQFIDWLEAATTEAHHGQV